MGYNPVLIEIQELDASEDRIEVRICPHSCNLCGALPINELPTAIRRFIEEKLGKTINVLNAEEDSIGIVVMYRDLETGELKPVFPDRKERQPDDTDDADRDR